MIDKLLSELITEIKKIRNDMDAVKAYTKNHCGTNGNYCS